MAAKIGMKFGNVGNLANRNLLSEFRELWFGDPVIPCGDMHQSFTGTLVKWFSTTSLFADSSSVLFYPLRCPRISCKRSVQVPCIARWFPATAQPSATYSQEMRSIKRRAL